MSGEWQEQARDQIDVALDHLYTRLDSVQPAGVSNTRWLVFVENHIGSGVVTDGYTDWVKEGEE